MVSQETASSSAECSRAKPPFSFVRGQDSTTTTYKTYRVTVINVCRMLIRVKVRHVMRSTFQSHYYLYIILLSHATRRMLLHYARLLTPQFRSSSVCLSVCLSVTRVRPCKGHEQSVKVSSCTLSVTSADMTTLSDEMTKHRKPTNLDKTI